ncbi:class I SAM-dependent methyltransferase [Rhodovibrionaceae bacterium A322]
MTSQKQQALKENHFDKGGQNYALHRPTYPDRLAHLLADLSPSRDLALDVGCGNGQLSCLLAKEFAQVIATDPSAEQIANARPCPSVIYKTEAAEQIDLEDRSVDLIVAAQAAHWFDLPRFYEEVRRVSKPGGALALISYGVPELQGEIGALFNRFYWQDIHHFWPAGRKHVEEGYKSLSFPFEETPLPALAIERQWTCDEVIGYIRTWSAARQAETAGEIGLFDAFYGVFRQAWGDPQVRHPIVWPIVGRLAIMP